MDKFYAGQVLHHVRRLARKELEDVAGVLGVSRSAVGHWETGRALPRPEQLGKLAAFYGIPFETLAYEIGYPMSSVAVTLRDWYAQQRSGKSSETSSQNPAPGLLSLPKAAQEWEEGTNFQTLVAAALRGHRSKVSAPLRT